MMKSRAMMALALALALTAVAATGVQAQGFLSGQGLRVSAALNMADAYFTSDDTSNDLGDYAMSPGLSLGVARTFPMGGGLDVEAGLTYSNVAFKTAGADPYTYRMNYVGVEGLVRYTVSSFFVNGGGYFDYGLSGKQTMPSGNEVGIFEEEALNRMNMGVEAGIGMPLAVAGHALELSLSQRIGLNDIEGAYDQDNQKATIWVTSLGVSYGL